MIRVGIIGRARWGQLYVQTLRELGLSPAWVCGAADTRFDADAIIIATPAETHFDLAMKAMANGCHVLVEKPMAMSSAQAEKMVVAARARGGVAWVGHTHLFSPAWREFKHGLNGDREGFAIFGGPTPAPKWWCKGSHAIAMTIDLFGPAVEWVYDDGVLEVECERGRCVIRVIHEPMSSTFVVGDKTYSAPDTTPSPMQVLVQEFLSACQHGVPDVSGFELGRRVSKVLSACPG